MKAIAVKEMLDAVIDKEQELRKLLEECRVCKQHLEAECEHEFGEQTLFGKQCIGCGVFDHEFF